MDPLKNIILQVLVLFIAAFCIFPVLAATEIYVNANSGNDDTGNGSIDSPYLTLTKGIQEVDEGGTVHAKPGIYIEASMITIDKDITITGDSTASTIIDGNNHHPLFKINYDKTVEMNYLTIRNGLANDTVNNISQNDGGGIYNSGTLTLNNCTVSGNTAEMGGGQSIISAHSL